MESGKDRTACIGREFLRRIFAIRNPPEGEGSRHPEKGESADSRPSAFAAKSAVGSREFCPESTIFRIISYICNIIPRHGSQEPFAAIRRIFFGNAGRIHRTRPASGTERGAQEPDPADFDRSRIQLKTQTHDFQPDQKTLSALDLCRNPPGNGMRAAIRKNIRKPHRSAGQCRLGGFGMDLRSRRPHSNRPGRRRIPGRRRRQLVRFHPAERPEGLSCLLDDLRPGGLRDPCQRKADRRGGAQTGIHTPRKDPTIVHVRHHGGIPHRSRRGEHPLGTGDARMVGRQDRHALRP